MSIEKKLLKNINLKTLMKILKNNKIEYEYHQNINCVFIGLYDNLVYFYEDKYKIYDYKNEEIIINYLTNIINKLTSNNIELKHNYIFNEEKFIVNNKDYLSSSNVNSFYI